MKIPPAIITPLAYLVYKLWSKTLRVEEVGRDLLDKNSAEGKLFAVCLWHDELFSLIDAARQLKTATLVSKSRDGEYLTLVMKRFGLYPVRGSSSRGGQSALYEMIHLMRQERYHACVTVDGPRGPRHVIKDGIFFMAVKANSLLTPIRLFYEKSWKFKSWDRFQLPKPFSRVRIVYGESYGIGEDSLDDSMLEAERQKLLAKMDELEINYAFKK